MRKRNNILIKEFFDDMILQKPTRENLAATKRRIKLFQNFLKVQNLYILEITKKDILKYLSQFKRLSKNTIRSYYFAIRKIYNFLMDEGYIQRNPCIKVKLPKQPKPLPEFYTDKELQDILNYYNPETDYISFRNCLILYFLAGTGIRKSELGDLKPSDFTIVKSSDPNSKIDIYIKICHGKGDKERITDLPGVLVGLYLLYYEKYLKNKTDDHLFYLTRRSESKPLSADGIYRVVKETTTLLNIKKSKRHPHIFRHTFIRNAIADGKLLVDEAVILQEIVGWVDLSPLPYYYQTIPEKRKLVSINKNILNRIPTLQQNIFGKIFKNLRPRRRVKEK